MSYKILFYIIFLLNSIKIFSQEISGKVLSKNTKLPIENASIISDLNTGAITDKNGNFTISINKIKTLRFSFLGFEPKTIRIEDLKKKNYIIYLYEITNELDEIKITSYTFSLDSLLKKTIKSMNKNYFDTIIQQDMFLNKINEFNFKNISVDLKSGKNNAIFNQKKMQNELNDFSQKVMRKSIKNTSSFKGILVAKKIRIKNNKEIYYKTDFKNIEGYSTNINNENNSMPKIEEDIQQIILKHVNQRNSFKVKSGFFKVEDSLFLNKKAFEKDSLKNVNFSEFEIGRLKSTAEIIGTFFKKTNEENYLNSRYYQHKLENTIVLRDDKIYVISFSPKKASAKYQGKIFINSADFTISKLSVGFADGKRGQHLNLKILLGVKFEENLHDISIHYQKMDNGKIITKYVKEKKGRYIYTNRPFKFIENSKNKNTFKFDFKAEIFNTETFEILFKNSIFVSKIEVKQKDKDFYKKRTPFLTKEEYSKTTWKNRKEIEEYLNSNQ